MIKKGVHGKNKVISGLSSCVIQKFSGYEIMENSLQHKEKRFLQLVTIAYEPVINDSAIKCFFTDSLHLAFRSCTEYKILHPATRQCYYCDNYFSCSKSEILKHVKRCTSIEGIIYKFGNNKIISFHFKYLGDVPFTVRFNFETTTGNSVVNVPKMFVISYCQITNTKKQKR